MSWEQNFERVEIEEPRRARARRPANGHGGGQPGPSPITFYRGSAYRQAPKREMVVKGLMGSGELTFTHGPPSRARAS